jgi:sigma-B regulation protein RsbU (phosphoserine phosphatase)
VSAALLTGVVKMSLHRRFEEDPDPAVAMRDVNRDLLPCCPVGEFVTVCVGIWNPSEKSWRYCSAGHPGGVVISDGVARTLPPTGPLLGVMDEAEWTSDEVRLAPGDRLFLYTDGVSEAGAPENEIGETGVEDLLKSGPDGDIRAQVRKIMAEVLHRCTPTFCDDATVVAVEVKK